jgi:hypothetical protein
VLQLLAMIAVAVIGVVEEARDPAYGRDRALLGATFGFFAPLLFYALFEIVHRKQRTRALVEPLARHGQSRRTLAIGVLGALALSCAASGLGLGLAAVVSTWEPGDTRFGADLLACAWGGAAIGGAYAGLYAVGSLLGRAGRLSALALDWVFGSGAGYLALPFPRSSARSLLGGEPGLGLPQVVAFAVLLGLSLAGVFLSAARSPR